MSDSSDGRVTAMQIARKLGVSQSAVSLAFNPKSRISQELRARVLETAGELGYRPNKIARALLDRSSDIVAIVVSGLVETYRAALLEELNRKLREAGMATLLFSLRENEVADDLLPDILQYQVTGIVLASGSVSDRMASICARSRTPVVLINRVTRRGDVDVIRCDNVLGGSMAAQRLLAAGCRRIAVVGGPAASRTHQDRLQGFRARLARAGMEIAALEGGDFSYAGGLAAAERLVRRVPDIDGVFCANDLMATAFIDAARGIGWPVPDRVSVIGFDGSQEGARAAYALTTVCQPLDEMAKAARGCIERARGGAVGMPVAQVLAPTLLERRSVRTTGKVGDGPSSSRQ